MSCDSGNQHFLDALNATASYGEDRFVYNFSLGKGEFVGLTGESGSGKTTFLRLLCGLEKNIGGSITLDGVKIDRVPVRKRGIGMVFQGSEIFENLTVNENLLFPLLAARISVRQWKGRIFEGLRSVGLSGYGRKGSRSLSGGEKQRLALARALMVPPRVLLLDEPFSSIDVECREAIKPRLKEACRGVSVIMVSHNEGDFAGLADRIVSIREILERTR